MNATMMLRGVSAGVAVLLCVAVTGCPTTQGNGGAGTNEGARPADPSAKSDPVAPVQPTQGPAQDPVELLKSLWAKGSGFCPTVSSALEAKTGSHCEIYGRVVNHRVANVPGLATYQLLQYLVKVERVWGSPNGGKFIPAPGADPSVSKARRRPATSGWELSPEDPADGHIEDGPIGAGDYVWVSCRVITQDRLIIEQTITKGERFWAAFDSMPKMAEDPFLGATACPTAWTIREMAMVMAGGMGS